MRKVEHVRNLGKLSAEEQKAKADERAEAARIKAEAQATREVVERSAAPAGYHGVIIPEAPAETAATSPAPALRPDALTAPAEREQAPESIPEPRTSGGPEESGTANAEAAQPKQPKRLPYDDAFYCVHHLHQKMDAETFVQGARVWMDVMREQHPDAYQALLAELGAR
ncbi:hypothetical protein NGM36_02865 [Streptomyces mutabilis]|uniref:hypothetical protein n=1 Tax=Streptomyces mutabilis TaxID=67332 RepID=UPI0022BA6A98|nr:hypothetical protein [Streptomyces mutabilis]MCZ9348751.1 hypothetical protein [Streptomyces mutabilis]